MNTLEMLGLQFELAHVHDAAIDVSKLLKAKQPSAMGGIIEGE